PETPTPRVSDLELVPADVPLFATLGVSTWWNGEQGQLIRQQLTGMGPAVNLPVEIEKVLGVPPDQAERVTALVTRTQDDPVIVVATASPSDRQRVLSLLAPAAVAQFVGTKQLHLAGSGTVGVHFVNDRLYVFGSQGGMRNFLSAPATANVTTG